MLNRYLKNIGLKGREIISLPGAPTCLGPALQDSRHNNIKKRYDKYFLSLPGMKFRYLKEQALNSKLLSLVQL
jgi:hypothetical protein